MSALDNKQISLVLFLDYSLWWMRKQVEVGQRRKVRWCCGMPVVLPAGIYGHATCRTEGFSGVFLCSVLPQECCCLQKRTRLWAGRTDIDLLANFGWTFFQNSERYRLRFLPTPCCYTLFCIFSLTSDWSSVMYGSEHASVCMCVLHNANHHRINSSPVGKSECQLSADASIYISAAAWQMRFPLYFTALLFLTVMYEPSEVTNIV